MWIFPHPFLIESRGIFPHGNFPQNFKMQYKDIGRVPVEGKYPSDDLMSYFGELKCYRFGETSLSSQHIFENSS